MEWFGYILAMVFGLCIGWGLGSWAPIYELHPSNREKKPSGPEAVHPTPEAVGRGCLCDACHAERGQVNAKGYSHRRL